jgi:uncharacterized CHY-type Zn-finger protein
MTTAANQQTGPEKKITCGDCRFSVPRDPNERVLLCDNPQVPFFGRNVTHGTTYACGYGKFPCPVKETAK